MVCTAITKVVIFFFVSGKQYIPNSEKNMPVKHFPNLSKSKSRMKL